MLSFRSAAAQLLLLLSWWQALLRDLDEFEQKRWIDLEGVTQSCLPKSARPMPERSHDWQAISYQMMALALSRLVVPALSHLLVTAWSHHLCFLVASASSYQYPESSGRHHMLAATLTPRMAQLVNRLMLPVVRHQVAPALSHRGSAKQHCLLSKCLA